MKVLFVYKYAYIEPIGLMYLSSVLRQYGHETFFCDVGIERDIHARVAALHPDMVAYSVVTGTHRYYAALNRSLKQRGSFFAVFGGPHPTFYPDYIHEPGVDAICVGEGEDACAELATKLERGDPITDIANIWLKQGDTVYKNPVRDLRQALDDVPFPDRALVYAYEAYKKRSNKYVLTSRGCPYNCTYCFNHSLKKLYRGRGRYCRKRSVENVLEEIQTLLHMAPVKRIQFFDDVFILDKQWVLDFCDAYRRSIGLPFICYVRVNLLDEDIVRALKEAGVVTVTFAIESGNSVMRNQVLRRNISDRAIISAAELMHKYKINFFTQNMVGLPGETVAKALETLAINVRCRPSYANASLFQPYPGLALTGYARDGGYYSSRNEILHDSFYEKSVLDLPQRRQLQNLCRLFSLAVACPALLPLVRLCLNLPDNIIFKALWHVTRSYGYFFKINWINPRDVMLPFWEKAKQKLRA